MPGGSSREGVHRTPNQPARRPLSFFLPCRVQYTTNTVPAIAIAVFCLPTQGRVLARQDTPPSPSRAHRAIYSGSHGRPALPVPDGEAISPYHIMEEFEEAEILWPADGSDDRGNSQCDVVVDDGGEAAASMPACSVRPEAAAPRPAAAAPVEISRRKRRCRPWPASEYNTTTFDQETDDDDDAGRRTDDAKGTTSDGLVIVPPHVLVARRRRLVSGRTAAYSMCAGRGRTLKGRDLRDVRNRVLKMTGFIEE